MQIKWLHLSDWHQGRPVVSNFDQEIVQKELLEDIQKRVNIDPRLQDVNFVVFSGDLSWSGAKEEFDMARDFLLNPILEILKLDKNRLFIAPGNHDFDLGAKELLPSELQSPLKSSEETVKWLHTPKRLERVLDPFEAYASFVTEFSEQTSPNYASVTSFELDGVKMEVICLNSAWMCARNYTKEGRIYDKGYLIIGEPQLQDALNNISDADFRMFVFHHPLTWLADFDQKKIKRRITEWADFILHGHEHEPDAELSKNTVGEYLIVPAGAAFDERTPSDPRYANSYNFVLFDTESKCGTVFFRRWNDKGHKFVEDADTAPNGKYSFSFHGGESFRIPDQEPPIDVLVRYEEDKTKATSLTIDNENLPFVGLSRIDIHRYKFYAGREEDIEKIIDRLRRGQKLLVISGESGSGKSSLLEAGLLGNLIYRDAIPGKSSKWQHLFIRPGNSPFSELARRIKDKFKTVYVRDSDHMAQWLRNCPEAFAETVNNIIVNNEDKTELVIAIDQMEELFTLADTDEKKLETSDFLQMLGEGAERLPVRIIGTIRADYFNSLQPHKSLFPHFNKEGVYFLLPLLSVGILEAILKPIEAANWEIDQGLARQIAEEAGMNRGSLPLVAICMDRLQDLAIERNEPRIRKDDYETVGGLKGVIRDRADEAFREISSALGENQELLQKLLEQLFFNLVKIFEGKVVRQKIPQSLLVKNGLLMDMANKLVERRLLTRDEWGNVEVAHESLFFDWGLLRDWIEKHKEHVSKLRELEEREANWKDRAYLESKEDSDTDEVDRVVAAEFWLLDDAVKIEESRKLLSEYGTLVDEQRQISLFLERSESLLKRIALANTVENLTADKIALELKKGTLLERSDVRRNRIKPEFYVAITGDDDMAILKKDGRSEPKPELREITSSILNSENIKYGTTIGLKPLHLGAISGQKKIVRKILQLGASPDELTESGHSPLLFALMYEPAEEVARLLLEYGADRRKTSKSGWTPVLAAASGGKLALLRELLESGNDINAVQFQGWSALSIAVSEGHSEIVEFLIGMNTKLVSVKTYDGWAPLGIAAARGHLNIVNLFLKFVDINEKVSTSGFTALMSAAANGHLHITKALLSLPKIDINSRDNEGKTALMRVIESFRFSPLTSDDIKKKTDILTLLVRNGASLTIIDNSGKRALDYIGEDDEYKELKTVLKSHLPNSWHISARSDRLRELQNNLDVTKPWPENPYIKAEWLELPKKDALKFLNRIAELGIEKNESPLTLIYPVKRIRTAKLTCLPGWTISEALVERPENDHLAILTFFSNKKSLEVISQHLRSNFRNLLNHSECDLRSETVRKEYARLFCAYSYTRYQPGRIIEDLEQIPWLQNITDLAKPEIILKNIEVEYDAEIKQVKVSGTFLNDKNLVTGEIFFPTQVNENRSDLQAAYGGKQIKKDLSVIAESLPLQTESFQNDLRFLESAQNENKERKSTLTEAVENGDLITVKKLIATTSFSKVDKENALWAACKSSQTAIVEFLLIDGVNGEFFPNNRNGGFYRYAGTWQTPLHLACQSGSGPIAELLLSASSPANPETQDSEGRTSLMLAAKEGHAGIVKLLLKNGAQTEREDSQGRTALFYAVQSPNRKVLDLLIRHCDLNKNDDEGNTALSVALEQKGHQRKELFSKLFNKNKGIKVFLEDFEPLLFDPTTATSQIVSYAMQKYRSLKIDFSWPALPKLHADWNYLPRKSASELTAHIYRYIASTQQREHRYIFNGGKNIFEEYLVLDARNIDLPFYRNWQLFEMMLQPIYNRRGKVIISFLKAKSLKRSDPEISKKIVFLNGTSPAIHELNSRLKIDLTTTESLLAYLRFFCAYVWGDGGGFWIVDDLESLPWKVNSQDRKARLIGNIQEPKIFSNIDNKIRATVLYATELFEAIFSIPPEGMISMDEDTSITLPLPLKDDQRTGIYRFLDEQS